MGKHSGSWYTDNEESLKTELNHNLSAVSMANVMPKALICPHAGFTYSGPTAAYSFKYLSKVKGTVKRIFILGPSHKKHFNSCALSVATHWMSTLGKTAVDTVTIEQLAKEYPKDFISLKIGEEENEHSLEMQIPYIQHILGDSIKIVPIMVGNISYKQEDHYGQILSKQLHNEENLFVISSDFCHWGNSFDYTPFEKIKGDSTLPYEYITHMDHKGMSIIESNQPKEFKEQLNETQNTICGRHPIGIFLNTIKYSEIPICFKFVQYAQSNKAKKQSDTSVSYAAAVAFNTTDIDKDKLKDFWILK